MNSRDPPASGDATEEISALVNTLHKTQQRLEELTEGEVDAVSDRDGRTFLLRRAQEQLRHSEAEKQAAILDALPAQIALLDHRGVIVSANDTWRSASPNAIQSPGHATGSNYLEICNNALDGDSQDARQIAKGIRSVLSGEAKSFSHEYPSHSPSERHWFLLTVTPLSDDRPNGAVVMHLDITERKRSEEALSRLASAMDATADAIYLVDRSTMQFIHVNEAACRMQGRTRDELVALGPDGVLSIPRAELERTYDSIIASGVDAEPLEMLRRRRDGTEVWVELRRHALHSEDGWTIVTLARDVTARRKAHERIAYLNRVYAVLSGINTLIMRVSTREELFREATRIAVDEGGFRISMIAVADRNAMQIVPVASAGMDEELLRSLKDQYAHGKGPTLGNSIAAQAIRQKLPVVLNDTANDPRVALKKQFATVGICSLAILPLVVSDEAAGVLALYASEIDFFHADEMKLLTELADDIAFAVGHIERTRKLARITRVNAMLSGINAAIVRIRDRQELFEESCRIAFEVGGLPFVWLGVVDEVDERLRLLASAGGDPAFLETIGDRLSLRDDAPAGHGVGARSVREKRPVAMNDANTDAYHKYRNSFAERGIKSVAAFPLLIAGRAVGTFALHATEAGFFDEDEMRLLGEVTGNIAFALEHIEKAQKLARMTRMNAVLSGINGAIVQMRDRKRLFQEVCRIAVETGGLPFCWLCMVDGTGEKLLPVGYAGPDDGFLEMIVDRLSLLDNAPNGHGISARAVREKRAIRVGNVAASASIKHKKPYADRGIKSSAAFPLFIGGRVIGSFSLNAAEVDFFDDEEMKLLEEVAHNIAFALEHIEKEEKVRRLTRVYAVLSGINALIARARDRDELFSESCRIAIEAGDFAKAWIGTLDPASRELRMVAAHGGDPLFFKALEKELVGKFLAGKGLVARAASTMQPVVSNDTMSDPEILLKGDAIAGGVRSIALLPLVVSETVVGVLALNANTSGFFDEEEMKLLAELARNIAFAIDHIGKQDRLDYFAYYDALTGLANRALFLDRLAQYTRSAVTGGHKLALFLLDLERFRNINDSLGRPAGDALLKQVADWLTQSVGDASLLAHLGSDQFAVVLPEVRQAGEIAALLDKRIRDFQDHTFRVDETELRLALRVGVALFPNDGTDAATLLRNAEAALKNAKASGDRHMFYAPRMTEAVAGKLTLENQLRRALEKEEFVLHYQPKVNLESGKLTSAEALIRWNDPQTGLVPPGKFIPILEETGLIYEVGRWALRKAVEDYLRWRAAGLPAVRIAVNVSPLQLRNRGFVAEIKDVVGIHADASAGLEIEITESVIMEDVKNSIASLQAIRAMGVTVAIDDFGTGFSSLSHLARLPVDTLKIDRSFITDMTSDAQGLSLVSTIINLAYSLKLKVVAEGVETEEQSRLLRLLRCNEMQGFLFSKPVPAEVFEARFLALPVPA